jgi:hypothetical protein
LSLGVVLGPEGSLIAFGGWLGVLAVRLVKWDAPARTSTVVAAAGSFAAIITLLGSLLLGAFLLMEASGLAGAMLELVLVPGLLAAGVGSLIFLGLDAWAGLGTFSLAIPGLPHVGRPRALNYGGRWRSGIMAALAGSGIRWLGLFLRPHVERADAAGHPGGRLGRRGACDRVRGGHRQGLLRPGDRQRAVPLVAHHQVAGYVAVSQAGCLLTQRSGLPVA